jgi:DNA mismatch repair protein MutS
METQIRAYITSKSKNPDAIAAIRIGDFYEFILDDAEIAKKVLGLCLTHRKYNDDLIPLCGIPYHCIEGYLIKLLRSGYKISVMENPVKL